MRAMTNTFIESEEKSYEYYDKGYGLRKHPRILLTLPIELTYMKNQKPLSFECEAKDISAEGMFLKFIAPREELHSLIGKSVEVSLANQKAISEKSVIKGKFAWISKPAKNPADGNNYIFCGIQFEKELPLSIQLEQLAISAHNTLEKLVDFYKKNLDQKHHDQLKQLSEIWFQIRSNVPEITSLSCVFWYYFSPQDVFIKNSMSLDKNNSVLYRLSNDANIREHLMVHRIPILESELAGRVFHPVSNEKDLQLGEYSLSEWLFPLFNNDEFLGLAQFSFKREIGHLFGIDKMFWLCMQIGNYVSSVIESEELKRDNDYTEILSQIVKLSKHQSEKRELLEFYAMILTKFSELFGEVPCILNVFSGMLTAEEHNDSANNLALFAALNIKDVYRNNMTETRMIGKDAANCCPLSLLDNRNSHFCEFNCSPNKRSRMFCIPLLSKNADDAGDQTQNELIAIACFAISQNFNPTQRLMRRIGEVSQTSSLFTQLCLRFI